MSWIELMNRTTTTRLAQPRGLVPLVKVLEVDPQVHTLLDFHFHPHLVAPSGKQGQGSHRDGANGQRSQSKRTESGRSSGC